MPKCIRVDDGSQITSKGMDLWAYANDFVLDFSRPGKPTDNAFIEALYPPADEGTFIGWGAERDCAPRPLARKPRGRMAPPGA